MTEKSPRDVALDAMPGHREAEAALAAIRGHRPQRRDAGNGALVDEVLAAVSAGEPVPADLGIRAYDLASAAAYAEAEMAVVNRVSALLKDRVDETYRRGVDAGIRALQPVFAGLLDEVRALAPALGGVRDAAGAVAAGPQAFTVWHQLGVLADRHRSLRGTWGELLRATGNAEVQLSPEERRSAATSAGSVPLKRIIAVAGEMSNLDDVWPDWPMAYRGIDPRSLMPGVLTTTPPWPGEVHVGEIRWPRDPEFLVWLATHPVARPWLPTTVEARAAYVAQCSAAKQRQTDAEEMERYGRVRTTPERVAAASAKQAEHIRAVDRAASWSRVDDPRTSDAA